MGRKWVLIPRVRGAVVAALLSPSLSWATPTTIIVDLQPGDSLTICGAPRPDGTQLCRNLGAAAGASAPAASAVPAALAKAMEVAAKPGSTGSTTESAQAKVDAFQQIADLGQVNLSAPSSPAAAVLGLSPDKVDHPGTIRDFVGSVVRGLGKDGKPVNGVAIDISPLAVFDRNALRGGSNYAPLTDGATYHSDASPGWLLRVAARTTVSLASTSADSSGASRMSFGLRTGLFDNGDPGLYAGETAKCVRGLPAKEVPKGRVVSEVANDLSACDPLTNKALSLWAKPAVYAGFGQSWYSHSGAVTDHAPDVKQFWLTGSIGLTSEAFGGKSSTLTQGAAQDSLRVLGQLYVGRRLDDRQPDPNDSTKLLSANATEFITRLTAGKSTWHTFAEVGRNRMRLGNNTTENLRHVAFGAEFKISAIGDDSWLELATVNDRGYQDGKDHSGVTMNFKFGAPVLTLPGPK